MATLVEKLREMDHVLKISELALILRVSTDLVYRLVGDNQIPHFRVGKSVRFDPQIVANWIERREINLEGRKTGLKYFLTNC